MERRYGEPLSREELAGIAGMSPWHYSHLFKSVTGSSPHRYLSEVRIDRAKLLLRSGVSSRETANRVGYADDSQFRRKFKETVGVSPSVYASRAPEKIAAVSYHYAAHLLALDIVPYAAPVDRERERHRSRYHDLIPVHLHRRKTMPAELWRINMQSLAQAKPEMILCDEIIPPEINERLRKIAPTVVVPWMDCSWREQFRRIARLLGKDEAVDRWISDYDRKAAEAAAAIRDRIGDETVALAHVMLGELIVYGRRNGGAVLFDDLRLRPACDTDGITVFRPLPASELSKLQDSDHLLLVVDRDEDSQAAWAQLQRHPSWQSLRAVRKGRVRLIDETPWLEYSPYAHELVLLEARRLFAGEP